MHMPENETLPSTIEAIRAYKSILAAVIEQRPSGTRQRLADALGKHRSFITQITSPAYPTPIPAKHLPSIFSVCHLGQAERDAFLVPYHAAHPGKAALAAGLRKTSASVADSSGFRRREAEHRLRQGDRGVHTQDGRDSGKGRLSAPREDG